MPTYQYYCHKCEQEFDKFQSMTDKPLKTCPKDLCQQSRWGKGKVKRVIGSGAGLIFKGSGFYITDYRSENYKAAAKKDAPATAASDSGKSDKKAAAGDGSKSGASSTPATTAKSTKAKE